jgi:phosphohistidine phosphatase
MTPRSPADTKPAHAAGYELYIMRHGIAVERGTAGYADDAKRPLTAEGKKKMQAVTAGLVRVGFDPDWIVTSPLVRAAETAEIVADGLGDALRPGGSAEALLTFLAKQPGRRRVLVVGHEPDLSELAARLVGAGRHARLGFKKGGCCLITFDEFPPRSAGQLVWWLTPRLMRKLA